MSFKVYQNFARSAVDSFMSYGLLMLQSAECLTDCRWTHTGCSDFSLLFYVLFFCFPHWSQQSIDCPAVLECFSFDHRHTASPTLTRASYGCFFFKPVACADWWHSRWSKKNFRFGMLECYWNTVPEITELFGTGITCLSWSSLRHWPDICFSFNNNL